MRYFYKEILVKEIYIYIHHYIIIKTSIYIPQRSIIWPIYICELNNSGDLNLWLYIYVVHIYISDLDELHNKIDFQYSNYKKLKMLSCGNLNIIDVVLIKSVRQI